MEEKKVHIWTVIKYAGAFIAFMIGSGFASGQEIMQFFTSFGLWGVAGALISMFLFSWSGAVIMGRGFDHKDEKDFSPFRYYCGKYLGIFFEWFIPFFLFCVVVTMISGAGATVPISGFGYLLANGAIKGAEKGFFYAVTGSLSAASAGVTAAVVFSLIMSLIFHSKTKRN